ncbi:hypothetical protein [Cerasicoccus maritimus]|uniref:hypothetical protein n=1 Tax=Cerasicoccus maritimus TaxID=490089 RepID=UPI0028524AA2|nr:hypothetical protein [Cerasicoccus maritimus]
MKTYLFALLIALGVLIIVMPLGLVGGQFVYCMFALLFVPPCFAAGLLLMLCSLRMLRYPR